MTKIQKSKDSTNDNFNYKPKKYKVASFILVALLSTVLLAGGILSYFSYSGSTHLVTVDGKEIIKPNILDSIRSQMASLPVGIDNNQKLNYVLQMLQQPIEEAVWAAFGAKKKLNYSANDIQNSLREIFNSEKETYEKEQKSHFPLTYSQFLGTMLDQFSASMMFINTQGFSVPNPLMVAGRYALNKTSSIIDYKALSLQDYLFSQKEGILSDFYERSNLRETSSKEIKLIMFPNEKSASDFEKKLESDSQLKKTAFDKSPLLTFDKVKNSQDYIFIQNNKVGSITSSFPYKDQFAIAKIEKETSLIFKELPYSIKVSVIDSYIEKLSSKEKNSLIEKVQKVFNEGTSPLIKKGKSSLINLSESNAPTDNQTRDLLSFIAPSNKEFYKIAFKKEQTVSETQHFNNTVYKITVVQRISPTFPIPLLDQEMLEKDILDLEKKLWYTNAKKEAISLVKVDYSMENLQKILTQ